MSDGLVRAMIIRQVQTLISVEEVAFCQDRLVEVRNINGREAIKCVGHDGNQKVEHDQLEKNCRHYE